MNDQNILNEIHSVKCIETSSFTNYILKNLSFFYNIKGDSIFPGAQPVSIEKKDNSKLSSYPYNIGCKYDGTRFILYLLNDKNNNNRNILINRALQFFDVDIHFENNVYNNTILDGELVKIKENDYIFYIHDAVVLCGSRINKNTHLSRLSDTEFCVNSYFNKIANNSFNIIVKKFYKIENFNKFIKDYYEPEINYVDGLIFMPDSLPVITGTQYSLLKWKQNDKHTFDFLIKEKDKSLIVEVFYLGKFIEFAKIHYDKIEGKEFIEKTKSLPNYKNGCILECNYDTTKQNFIPLFIRTDKTHPNSLRTIERTLFNINENIMLDDFKIFDKHN